MKSKLPECFCWLLVFLAACPPVRASGPSAPNAGPVWPPAPDQPRVAYIQSFSRPSDLGIKGSAIKRLAGWITGTDTASETQVSPVAVAVDETGGICLADTGTKKVSFYDAAARRWFEWDHVGPVAFQLPVAVAKRGGTIFATDAARAEVIAFDTGGKLLFRIDHDFKRPCGLAVFGERLYVTDVAGHCVVAFDLQGRRLFSFGRRGEGPGEFNYPTHAAAAPGRLLITDALNSRVQVFDPEGRFQGVIGGAGDTSGHFARPKGVAVDGFGHIYVADALFNNIQVFDFSGRLLLNLGGAGSGPGQFGLPNGIAISGDNHIYVADSCNHRVQVLRYIGPP